MSPKSDKTRPPKWTTIAPGPHGDRDELHDVLVREEDAGGDAPDDHDDDVDEVVDGLVTLLGLQHLQPLLDPRRAELAVHRTPEALTARWRSRTPATTEGAVGAGRM